MGYRLKDTRTPVSADHPIRQELRQVLTQLQRVERQQVKVEAELVGLISMAMGPDDDEDEA